MIPLTKETIDKIFDKAKEQYDYTLALYRIAFPDYDSIISIDGHPQVSRSTGEYIFDKAIAFDKIQHPNVVNGGLWLNKGFGSNDGSDKDWKIDVSTCKTKYNEPATEKV